MAPKRVTPTPTPTKMPPPTQIDVRGQADFARRLRRAMRAKGMSQSDLAAAIWGYRDATMKGTVYRVPKNRERISVYLGARGGGVPRLDTLSKLAEALGTTPGELAPVVAQSNVPPEVTMNVLDGGTKATLRVDTVVSASLAMKIASLIQKERENAVA